MCFIALNFYEEGVVCILKKIDYSFNQAGPYPGSIKDPSCSMDSQAYTIHDLTILYTQNRYKSILEQTKAFQLLDNSRKETNNVLKCGSLLISDLAKRLYINQLKLNEYAISLAKYEDVNLIQNKYQRLPELQDSLLYQLVINAADINQRYVEPVIQQTNISFPVVNFDNCNQAYQENDFVQDYNVQEETQPYQQNQMIRNSYVGIQSVAKSKPTQNKNIQKSKKQNLMAKAGNGILSKSTKKKSKGYQIMPQVKLEAQSKYSLLPETDLNVKRLAISLDKDLKQQKQKRQQQAEKEQRKQKIKQQSVSVAQFVHSYLVSNLKYTDDHTNYIPKKSVLNLYLNWCKGMNRKVLFPTQMSIIQMFLTNQLKIAFSRIDVYSNNYKGLYLIDLTSSFLTSHNHNDKNKKKEPAQLYNSKTEDVRIQEDELYQLQQ